MARLTGNERIRQLAHEIRTAAGVAGNRTEECALWIMSEVREDGETCPAIMQLQGMLYAITEMAISAQALAKDLVAVTLIKDKTPSMMPVNGPPTIQIKPHERYELPPESTGERRD
jgi:hypothetical protein